MCPRRAGSTATLKRRRRKLSGVVRAGRRQERAGPEDAQGRQRSEHRQAQRPLKVKSGAGGWVFQWRAWPALGPRPRGRALTAGGRGWQEGGDRVLHLAGVPQKTWLDSCKFPADKPDPGQMA